MGQKLTLFVFLTFIGTFVYFAVKDDQAQSHSADNGGETVAEQTSSEPSTLDKAVAMITVLSFFTLYTYCPFFRDCVNIIGVFCVGGWLIKRLGNDD